MALISKVWDYYSYVSIVFNNWLGLIFSQYFIQIFRENSKRDGWKINTTDYVADWINYLNDFMITAIVVNFNELFANVVRQLY